MARPRSTAGSVPKPAISHSTLNNIWSSYFQKLLEARGRRLSPVPGVPRLYHSPLVSAAMWGLTELSRQVMIEIPGPAPCVVCSSQWSSGVRSTIYSIMYSFELKMYPCVLCTAEISSRKELDKHNRADHVGERAFLCSICTNAF